MPTAPDRPLRPQPRDDRPSPSSRRPPAPATRTRLTLRPGDNGTKKLVRKYGERLLAVRYRYDPASRRRFKTVELLEEELPWEPAPAAEPPADPPVLVRIAYAETELRQRAKALGAQWQPERKLWRLSYAAAQTLGLHERVIE